MKQDHQFSITQHVQFLAGYLDACARIQTSESEQLALAVREAHDEQAVIELIGLGPYTNAFVENWSREFGNFVGEFIGLDQRSRLGFYLAEYICWFKEFTDGAMCYRLHGEHTNAARPSQIVYMLHLEANRRVLLLADRTNLSLK